ncbi:unnamed protein product [Prunus armeniaca]
MNSSRRALRNGTSGILKFLPGKKMTKIPLSHGYIQAGLLLDYTNESAPFYGIGGEDIEALCLDLLPVQSEQANTVDVEGAEEHMAEEAVVEEDEAEEGATNEMVAGVVEQTSGVTEGVADRVDAKDAVD